VFFVRDHLSTPVLDVKDWKLSIEGSGVSRPLSMSYDDLLKLPSKTSPDISNAPATAGPSIRP
jgi:DMSO/TMAO reductase YedYZ molybdopterin-dependent catalytic subunit